MFLSFLYSVPCLILYFEYLERKDSMMIRWLVPLLLQITILLPRSCLCYEQEYSSATTTASPKTVAMRIAVGITMPIIVILLALAIRFWRFRKGYEYVPGSWRRREDDDVTRHLESFYTEKCPRIDADLERGAHAPIELPTQEVVAELPALQIPYEMPAKAHLPDRAIRAPPIEHDPLVLDKRIDNMRTEWQRENAAITTRSTGMSGAGAGEKERITAAQQAPEVRHGRSMFGRWQRISGKGSNRPVSS